jgi:hypothetical protein
VGVNHVRVLGDVTQPIHAGNGGTAPGQPYGIMAPALASSISYMTLAPPAGGVQRSGADMVQTQSALCEPAGVFGNRLPSAGAPPYLPFAFTLGSHKRRPVKELGKRHAPLGHALELHQRLLRPLAICAVGTHQQTWLRPWRRPLTRLRRFLRFQPGLGVAGIHIRL